MTETPSQNPAQPDTQTTIVEGMNDVRSSEHEQNDNWEWSASFTEFVHKNITGRSLKVCPGLRPICDVNLDIKHLGDIAESDNAAFSLTDLSTETTSDNQLSDIHETLADDISPEIVYGRITSDNPDATEPVLYDGYACQGDMFDLPFEDNSFDTVVSDPPWLNLSQDDRKQLFKEVVRVTKPTGKILYNATWIPEDEHTRQFELRFRQQKDFWGGPSFAAFYRRSARNLSELFDAHDYTSTDRYADDSVFWSESFHPNAVSAEHNTDPGKLSTDPDHQSECCPACGGSELHQVRDPEFESSNGEYNLYECVACGFRPTKHEVDELSEELESAADRENCTTHEIRDIQYTPDCIEQLQRYSTVSSSTSSIPPDLPWASSDFRIAETVPTQPSATTATPPSAD